MEGSFEIPPIIIRQPRQPPLIPLVLIMVLGAFSVFRLLDLQRHGEPGAYLLFLLPIAICVIALAYVLWYIIFPNKIELGPGGLSWQSHHWHWDEIVSFSLGEIRIRGVRIKGIICRQKSGAETSLGFNYVDADNIVVETLNAARARWSS